MKTGDYRIFDGRPPYSDIVDKILTHLPAIKRHIGIVFFPPQTSRACAVEISDHVVRFHQSHCVKPLEVTSRAPVYKETTDLIGFCWVSAPAMAADL